jgi:DNA-binding NarL/FixJ family response regulator
MIDQVPIDIPKARAPRLRTLIVDDNELVRRRLAYVVASIPGLQLVAEAADIPEALAALRAHELSVAILDLDLPGGSGLDILRHIRQSHPSCRVIMFSGMMTDWEAAACRHAGAEHCFNKVLEFDRLHTTLREWGQLAASAPG